MTITEFLLARVAEDEAEAKWVESEGDHGSSPIQHPARVLAECAAKRAIIALAQKASDDEKAYDDYEWQGTVASAEPLTGDAILYALAAVYADHPDYQHEWA